MAEERRKERSVPTGVHEREGARGSQAGWLHEKASYNSRPPLSSVFPAQCSEEWSSWFLSHAAHVRNSRCQSGRNVGGGCNNMSVCEIANASDIG